MITVELRGLAIFGHHGVREHEKHDGQAFLFDVDLEVGDRGAVRPARGRGRLPRGRTRREGALGRPRATTCSRRSRPRSPTSFSCASAPSACVVRVTKPDVQPGGLEGTVGVSVSKP